MAEIRLPKLGATMMEGTIVQWHVHEGDPISAGMVLYEVATDKANLEIEAEQDGTIQSIVVPEGETVPVGAVVARLTGAGADHALPDERDGEAPTAGTVQPHRGVRASPATRQLARRLGVDLALISGTGPRGRVLREDVMRHAPGVDVQPQAAVTPVERVDVHAQTPAPGGSVEPFKGMRQMIAQRMALAGTVPQVTLHRTISAQQILDARSFLKSRIPSLSVVDFVLRAAAMAVLYSPAINCWVSADGRQFFDHVNLGYAVDAAQGLVVPVIPGAERMSLRELSERRKQLTEKAVAGRLSPDDLTGATFTVTNLGPYGVEFFNPLINPPQAGILGVGAVRKQESSATLALSLTFDHRAIDGGDAARVLDNLAQACENLWVLL